MLPRNQATPACPCMTPGQSCFHQTTGTAPGGPLGRLDCSPSETHITSSGQVSPRFRPRADQMLSQEPRGPYIAQMGKFSSSPHTSANQEPRLLQLLVAKDRKRY